MSNREEWIKHWAGHWKLLNNSHLGYQYTKLLKKSLGYGFDRAIFISHSGYSTCYLNAGNYKKFSQYLADKIVTNKRQLLHWTQDLIAKTDQILNFINVTSRKKTIDAEDYNKFVKYLYEYCVPHRVVKVVVDSLPPAKYKEFLPQLQKARLYAEPVFAETEKFMELMAKQIATKTRYKKEHVLYVTREEIDQYWKTVNLPAKKELASRYKSCAIIYRNGLVQLKVGRDSDKFEKSIEKTGEEIKGQPAFPGLVKGKALVILDPKESKGFKKGDILVTGMTRPEFLPLMRKAAAFVTDAGGMLSHAAISARELKKPCIVGTKYATRVLKDGDSVEVDANKGTVRKI